MNAFFFAEMRTNDSIAGKGRVEAAPFARVCKVLGQVVTTEYDFVEPHAANDIAYKENIRG